MKQLLLAYVMSIYYVYLSFNSIGAPSPLIRGLPQW